MVLLEVAKEKLQQLYIIPLSTYRVNPLLEMRGGGKEKLLRVLRVVAGSFWTQKNPRRINYVG